MPRKAFHIISLTLAVLMGTLLLVSAAEAGSRELKNTGAVGESTNGYLAAVPNTRSVGVDAEVDAINAQRREAYLRAAADTGRSLAEIEAVAGARLREKAVPGDWIQNAAGEWIRKP
ncbi:MAG: YdbL family protein [Alphaproteobacteria bacterium]|jgi:hypothetical protein|nr:YdbL family protein [Alphaproteobacteria bacterium]